MYSSYSKLHRNLYKNVSQEYKTEVRLGKTVASFARSPLGKLLVDIYPNDSWTNIKQIKNFLLKQNGAVNSSYFEKLTTNIITEDDNKAIEIKKE